MVQKDVGIQSQINENPIRLETIQLSPKLRNSYNSITQLFNLIVNFKQQGLPNKVYFNFNSNSKVVFLRT